MLAQYMRGNFIFGRCKNCYEFTIQKLFCHFAPTIFYIPILYTYVHCTYLSFLNLAFQKKKDFQSLVYEAVQVLFLNYTSFTTAGA
jgi:hypothetical protein